MMALLLTVKMSTQISRKHQSKLADAFVVFGIFRVGWKAGVYQ